VLTTQNTTAVTHPRWCFGFALVHTIHTLLTHSYSCTQTQKVASQNTIWVQPLLNALRACGVASG